MTSTPSTRLSPVTATRVPVERPVHWRCQWACKRRHQQHHPEAEPQYPRSGSSFGSSMDSHGAAAARLPPWRLRAASPRMTQQQLQHRCHCALGTEGAHSHSTHFAPSATHFARLLELVGSPESPPVPSASPSDSPTGPWPWYRPRALATRPTQSRLVGDMMVAGGSSVRPRLRGDRRATSARPSNMACTREC